MCLAMPMKIDQIDGTLARCEAGGLSQNIRIDFITDPKPGDYVMVHAGFAIEKSRGNQKCFMKTGLKIPGMCRFSLKKLPVTAKRQVPSG